MVHIFHLILMITNFRYLPFYYCLHLENIDDRIIRMFRLGSKTNLSFKLCDTRTDAIVLFKVVKMITLTLETLIFHHFDTEMLYDDNRIILSYIAHWYSVFFFLFLTGGIQFYW